MRLGIGLSICGSMAGSGSVAPAVWAIDASGLTPGAYSAASLFTLGTGGLVLTRASAATVQTSATTVDSTPAANVPRVRSDGTITGLLLEESRDNYCQFSRGQLNSPWVSDATVTVDTAAGPDGAVVADRVNTLSTHSGSRQPFTAPGTDQTWSVWTRATSGTSSQQLLVGSGGAGSKCVSSASIDTTWRRMVVTGNSATKIAYVCEGENLTSVPGGIAAGARDCIVDMAQYETGKFPTSFIYTSGAASATRAGERLRHDTPSALLVAGRLGLAFALYPLGASTEYIANMRLWTIDASNYAEVDFSTRVVTVVIGGVTRTLAALPTWSRLDLLEIWIAAGDGSSLTLAKARINGGAVTDLGTGAAQAVVSPGGNPLEILCAGTAAQFSAVVKSLGNTQPAWAA